MVARMAGLMAAAKVSMMAGLQVGQMAEWSAGKWADYSAAWREIPLAAGKAVSSVAWMGRY